MCIINKAINKWFYHKRFCFKIMFDMKSNKNMQYNYFHLCELKLNG